MIEVCNEQLPEQGKIAIALNLAKREEGVSSLEALTEGAGFRLAAQIHRLKNLGHVFRDKWETVNGVRYKRYWWIVYMKKEQPA